MDQKALQTRPQGSSRSFALADYKRTSIAEAIKTPSMLACIREFGQDPVEESLVGALVAADTVLGGGMGKPQVAAMTNLFLDDFKGRPIGTILLAIRYGIQQKVIGHKLTYPLLCEWVNAIDAQVEEHNYNEHLRTK